MAIIYCATNQKNNKKYIGQTIKTLRQRKAKHIVNALHHNSSFKFHQAIRKYGKDGFEWTIIETVNESIIDERERYNINKFDSLDHGYNMTEGGQDIRGYRHTEETKKKIGDSMRGRSNKDHFIDRYGEVEGIKHYNLYLDKMKDRKGKTRLQGFIEKYGEKEGTKMYEEFIEKCRNAKLGKKLSEEHKSKIGKGTKGLKHPHTEQHKQHLKDAWIIRREREKAEKCKSLF